MKQQEHTFLIEVAEQPKVLRELIAFYRGEGQRLLENIEKHENVKMVITGHAHMNELILRKGKLFCTVAGACVYPMDYKVIDLSGDSVSVATRSFPDGSLVKASFAGQDWPRGQEHDRYFET